MLCFSLSIDQGRGSNDNLWLSIVGLTDQLIHERIDQEKYEIIRRDVLHPHVIQRNNAREGGGGEDEESLLYNIENNPQAANRGGLSSSTLYSMSRAHLKTLPRVGEIKYIEREYRFHLMRHWTLSNSMRYSSFVASRLAIWSDGGKKHLLEILATLGIPRQEAERSFLFMKKEYEKLLNANLPSIVEAEEAKNLKLQELSFHSYTRQHSSHLLVSAADVVHSIAALLEAPFQPPEMNGVSGVSVSGGQEGREGGGGEKEESSLSLAHVWEEYRHHIARQFNRCLDALSSSHSHYMKEGIELSKQFQECLIKRGAQLLQTGKFGGKKRTFSMVRIDQSTHRQCSLCVVFDYCYSHE